MPNHVSNLVNITGPAEVVARMRQEVMVHHPAKQSVAPSYTSAKPDELIFRNKNDTGYGWLNPENKVFRAIVNGELQVISENGVPSADWEPVMDEAFDHFDFERIKPMPEDVKATCGKPLTMEEERSTKGRNWYDWCSSDEGWGTKWNSYNNRIESEGDGFFECYFETAWSPPMPVFQALAEKYPELTIKVEYFDEGHNFWGVAEYSEGDLDNDDCRSDEMDDLGRRLCMDLKGYDPLENEEEEED